MFKTFLSFIFRYNSVEFIHNKFNHFTIRLFEFNMKSIYNIDTFQLQKHTQYLIFLKQTNIFLLLRVFNCVIVSEKNPKLDTI